MHVKLLLTSGALAAALALIPACRPDPNFGTAEKTPQLPDELYSYDLDMSTEEPISMPSVGFFNSSNPEITDAGATLGRVLFYDAKLSLNNRISCGSCHFQERAFADGKAQSEGFEGRITPRNAMAIINPGFNLNLFWDSRSSSALDLVARPIQNHIEMGMEDMETLSRKLAGVSYYPALFEQAFGSPEIRPDRISSALAQFVCSIVSRDSKFDRAMTAQVQTLSPLEQAGFQLFFSTRTNCSACHSGGNFAAPDHPGGSYSSPAVAGTANTGLEMVYRDPGKGDGKFRIPSLRNIALTGPYMHDGRFKTLEEVIDFYDRGIQPHTELDHNLRNPDGTPRQLNLNVLEKEALVAFLHTLTDLSMVQDPKFSDPFK